MGADILVSIIMGCFTFALFTLIGRLVVSMLKPKEDESKEMPNYMANRITFFGCLMFSIGYFIYYTFFR